MKRWKILNGNPEPHYVSQLEAWKSFADVDTVLGAEKESIAGMLPEYDVYLSVLGAPVCDEDIRRAPRLKMIATPSTGTDHLPVAEIRRQGIHFYSLRESPEFLPQITSTAELCWGLLLSLIRHIVPASQDVLSGQWRRQMYAGMQLSGRTLGIIGYGRLGSILGRYGMAFGMKVLASDIRSDLIPEPGVELCPLDRLLKQSDVVSLHIHLDESNRGFMNRCRLQQMKKGAILLNTSRGGILDEQALLEALESGHLSAAGVDVLDNEWHGVERHPLVCYARSHQNLLITPHCGGASLDAQTMTFGEMLRNVRIFMAENDAAPAEKEQKQ